MLQAVLQARLPVVVLLQLRKEKMTIAQAQQGLLHAAPRRRQLKCRRACAAVRRCPGAREQRVEDQQSFVQIPNQHQLLLVVERAGRPHAGSCGGCRRRRLSSPAALLCCLPLPIDLHGTGM